MPIDRIQCFGLQLGDGKLAVFKAGRLKYRSKEEKWKTQLIDGEHVEGPLWIDLTFDVLVMYLDQQLVGSAIPDEISTWENDVLPELAAAVTLKDILDAIYNAEETAIYFYPILLNQANTFNPAQYRVLADEDAIDLINAQSNGRFEMFTAISLKTKTPLTEYPSWINR